MVSIRRNRYPQMFLSTLVELGTIDDQLACFLQAAVPARMNIMIARGHRRREDHPAARADQLHPGRRSG